MVDRMVNRFHKYQVDMDKNKTQPVMIVPHGAMVVLVLMITVKNVKVTECLLMSVYVHQDI
jgi:aromatic ring-opening dioxygenase catalytic subunit (LigB family)